MPHRSTPDWDSNVSEDEREIEQERRDRDDDKIDERAEELYQRDLEELERENEK